MSSAIESNKLRMAEFQSLALWWDDLKAFIRHTAVNFSVRKHRKLNLEWCVVTKHLIKAKHAAFLGVSDSVSSVQNLSNN